MVKYPFVRGYNQVQRKDAAQVKAEIMRALRITTNVSWQARLHGKIEPKISEAKAIEDVFAKYGVTDVWGEE